MVKDIIKQRFSESANLKLALMNDESFIKYLEEFAIAVVNCLRNGGKLVICGNGGSASDALHFAGEIVGRFQMERNPWPAVVLNADVTTLTAIANDYGYEETFSRQAKAHLTDKDIFIGISTSGNSENVLRAVITAKAKGSKTAALLGKDGGKIGKCVAYPLIVPCNTTARVQECHICMIHIICEIVERKLTVK